MSALDIEKELRDFDTWFTENNFGGSKDSMWATWEARAKRATQPIYRVTPEMVDQQRKIAVDLREIGDAIKTVKTDIAQPATVPAQATYPAEQQSVLDEQVRIWRKEVARLNDLIAFATGQAAAGGPARNEQRR